MNTKKRLVASLLAMAMCFTMLIGSTFAWFTDTATTGVNKITSGNLDVKLYYSTDMAEWKDAENATEVFTADKWEPGYTEVVYFKVENAGSLAFDCEIRTNVVKETEGTNVAGNQFKLSDSLQFGIVETSAIFADRDTAIAAIETPNKFVNVAAGEKTVAAGEKVTFAMVVWMPTTVGNEANHNGVNKPEIQFGISVLAKQADVEKDSFDETYDENATYPAGPKLDAIVAAPKNASEFKAILDTAFTGGSAGTITINLENDFDFENNWETAISANYSGVNTVVINGNGHYIKNMNKPLIEGVFGGAGSLTFKNLTIKDSTISAAGGAGVGIGVFMNNADTSAAVTFENCTVENVVITNTADDSTLGGLIGYSTAKTLTVKNCTIKNSTLTGTKDIGAVVGYTQSAVTATDLTITGNTITSSNASTYRVGAIAGTFNSNPSTITTKDVSSNTITQANANTAKLHDYAGRIYTDVTVDGTLLPKN